VKRQVLRIVSIAAITAAGVLPFAAPAQADNAGVLNGNQVNTVVTVPINISCNAVAILGFASANCGSNDGTAAAQSHKWRFAKFQSRTWS
jgi:hypothetical protein